MSEITNCTIQDGQYWAVDIQRSNNIKIKNTFVYNHVNMGINVEKANNITLLKNVVTHI